MGAGGKGGWGKEVGGDVDREETQKERSENSSFSLRAAVEGRRKRQGS